MLIKFAQIPLCCNFLIQQELFPVICGCFWMRWLTYTSLSIAVEDKLHVAGTFGAMVRLLADVLAASIAVVARHYERRQE